MPLAPAISRGAALKARLAVNGIQNAARSFGAGGAGLLSSIGGLFFSARHVWRQPNPFLQGCEMRFAASSHVRPNVARIVLGASAARAAAAALEPENRPRTYIPSLVYDTFIYT
ncbi:MAG: hypothetical protein NTAFB05_03780 [Nitrobacter sp.]